MILKSNFTICDVINFRLELFWHRYHNFLIFLIFNFFKFLPISYHPCRAAIIFWKASSGGSIYSRSCQNIQFQAQWSIFTHFHFSLKNWSDCEQVVSHYYDNPHPHLVCLHLMCPKLHKYFDSLFIIPSSLDMFFLPSNTNMASLWAPKLFLGMPYISACKAEIKWIKKRELFKKRFKQMCHVMTHDDVLVLSWAS